MSRNFFISLVSLLLVITAGCSSTSKTTNSQQQISSSKTTQIPVQTNQKNTGNTVPYKAAPLHEIFDQGINGAALQATTGIDME